MHVDELADLGPTRRSALFDRDSGVEEVTGDVESIMKRVRERGDQAIRSYTEEFDGVSVGQLSVTGDLKRAVDEIDEDVREAIHTAAANIRSFHKRQVPEDWTITRGESELGRRYRPVERVGAYVPGGTATYPSSALMTVIPAKVAGVEHVSVVTPPGDPVNPVTLAACAIAGADEVYRVGGAQAIAALGYGTESIASVDRIVGPGNRWVAAAKRLVQRDVPIDLVAGPSEVLILADTSANPRYLAADLLAQAEHDPHSPCVLVTDDTEIAHQTRSSLDEMLDDIPRSETARAALDQPASGLFLARSMSEAISFAETFAPEHLVISVEDDDPVLSRIDSAGSIFLGPYSPVAAGDYASGTNHVLPTGGSARMTGGLSVDNFLRSTTIQRLDRSDLKQLAPTIGTLARAEGLEAHARSVEIRTQNQE